MAFFIDISEPVHMDHQEKENYSYSSKFNYMSAESSKKLKIKYISKPLDKQETLFYNDKHKE